MNVSCMSHIKHNCASCHHNCIIIMIIPWYNHYDYTLSLYLGIIIMIIPCHAPADEALAPTLQHTATRCNTLQHAATHRNTRQHTPNTLQHTYIVHQLMEALAPTLQQISDSLVIIEDDVNRLTSGAAHCNTLPHTATHCNILQHTATYCNTLQHTATHCSTLQHTVAHCNVATRW